MVPSSFFWQCLCQSTLRGANPLEPNPYPRLVGITTDWHQRHAILAGTRIWCFIKCITMNNPDLIRLIPVEGNACPVTKGGRPDFGSNLQNRSDFIEIRQTLSVHFRSRTFFSAARIFKRNAFNRINPVASLWSYAGASPSIVAIFGSYRLFGLLRPATILPL